MVNEKLKKVTAEPESADYEGETFTIAPLKVKDFAKVQMKGENSESQAVIELLYQSLKEHEDIDRDGIREAPLGLLASVQEKIEEVNNLEDFFDEDERQEALKNLG